MYTFTGVLQMMQTRIQSLLAAMDRYRMCQLQNVLLQDRGENFSELFLLIIYTYFFMDFPILSNNEITVHNKQTTI
jgi:hypothetical protein